MPALIRFFAFENSRILISALKALNRLLFSHDIYVSVFIDTGIFAKVTQLLSHKNSCVQKHVIIIISKAINAIITNSQKILNRSAAFKPLAFPQMKSKEKNLKFLIISRVFACFEGNSPLQILRQLFKFSNFVLFLYHDDPHWRMCHENRMLNIIFILELIIDVENELHTQLLKDSGVVARLFYLSSAEFPGNVKLAAAKLHDFATTI